MHAESERPFEGRQRSGAGRTGARAHSGLSGRQTALATGEWMAGGAELAGLAEACPTDAVTFEQIPKPRRGSTWSVYGTPAGWESHGRRGY